MRRALLVAAVACTVGLPAVAPVLEAQQRTDTLAEAPRTERRTPRRWIFALAGAAMTGAAASLYMISDDRGAQPGSCVSKTCVSIVAIGGGALIGYMVGREFDQLHALRYRGGAPLRPPSIAVSVQGEPLLLAVQDTLVAVTGGTGGVQVFTNGGDAFRTGARRATGVRGIEALAIAPAPHALAIGAPTGLYMYPPARGAGVLVREGRASAVAAMRDHIHVAVGTRIETLPVFADSARTWPGVEVGDTVRTIVAEPGRALLWGLTDSTLVALRPAGDSLALLSTTALGGPARRVTVDGERLAVAMGEGGVRTYDVSDPAAPRESARWTGARYVYDVSFAGPRLYVAAGVEGVYVLSVADGRLTTLGLARELGFATALESRDGFTFLIDRATNSLRRFPSDF